MPLPRSNQPDHHQSLALRVQRLLERPQRKGAYLLPVLGSTLSFSQDPPTLAAPITVGLRRAASDLDCALVLDPASEELQVACSVCGIDSPGCSHGASLAFALQRWLVADTLPPAALDFKRAVEPLSWSNHPLARTLGRAIASLEAAAETEQLMVELDLLSAPPSATLKAVKRSGSGFTKGRKLAWYDARDFRSDPLEIRLAGLLRAERAIGDLGFSADLLELLTEFPRVQTPSGATLSVEAALPSLELLRRDDGAVRLQVRLGDWRLGEPGHLVGSSPEAIFACADGCRVRFHALRTPAEQLYPALLRDDGGWCPPELLAPMLTQLGHLEAALPVELPAELRGKEVAPDVRAVVRLEPARGATRATILVRPLPGGAAYTPGVGPQRASAWGPEGRTFCTRELDRERDEAASVAEALALDPEETALLDEETLIDLLARLRDPALESRVAVEWPEGVKPRQVASQIGQLRVSTQTLADWFALEGELAVDGQAVALAALLQASREGRRYLEIDGGKILLLEGDLKKRLTGLAVATRPGAQGQQELSRAALLAADELLEGVELGPDLAQLRARTQQAMSLLPQLPEGLRGELRHYQFDGYRWMRRMAELGLGCCLADDMGLGKTVQAIALLLARAAQGPQLVIAPTSVAGNWLEELARFAPGLRVHNLRTVADRAALIDLLGPSDVVIASYGLLRSEQDALADQRFATLVLDEAHAIKNFQSETAKAARRIGADFKLGLTGTPLENHLGELWSLFQLLSPGVLGGWEHFSRTFATPIGRGGDVERQRGLAALVKPLLLRRTKDEVLSELPARTEVRLDVALGKRERVIYEATRLRALQHLEAEGGGRRDQRFAALAALMRLRQAASHARMIDPTGPVVSSKMAVLFEQLDELVAEGHCALVFTQFVENLEAIATELALRGISVLTLQGQTPAAERARRVARFQAGEAQVFVISLRAGGTGINLTAADYVFLMDPWWNPAVEDQAADRAHRMGQTRPVTITRLVAQGTIEDKVLRLHEQKRKLVRGVLEGTDLAATLDPAQLVELLREGLDAAAGPSDREGPPSEPPAARAKGKRGRLELN